jgi:hypothetical protein
MKKLIISVLTALVLVAVMAAPAIAEPDVEQRTASVTVGELINMTITDPGTLGINFGPVSAGSSDNPELEQNGTGAVTLTVEAETNVDCNIKISGDGDFHDVTVTYTFPLGNAVWDTDNLIAGATTMTTSYALIDTSTTGVQKVVEVYHWITIPAAQHPETYSAEFYYQAIAK